MNQGGLERQKSEMEAQNLREWMSQEFIVVSCGSAKNITKVSLLF